MKRNLDCYTMNPSAEPLTPKPEPQNPETHSLFLSFLLSPALPLFLCLCER